MPRRGENIYKRKDGRWEGRYVKGRDDFGKIKYGYVYADSYKGVNSQSFVQRIINSICCSAGSFCEVADTNTAIINKMPVTLMHTTICVLI